MHTNLKKALAIGGGVTLMLTACRKPIENTTAYEEKQQGVLPGVHTTIGKKLDNPYSLTNMRKAAKAIATMRRSVVVPQDDGPMMRPVLEVLPTHLYIKFSPRNWEEYDRLVTRESFVPYDYPLDAELLIGELGYHDPSVAEDMPTPQYASLALVTNPDQYGIPYELIDTLAIPDEGLDDPLVPVSEARRNSIIELVNTSMKMTGNEKDSLQIGTTARSTYRPAGRIRYMDTRLNAYMPLRGVRVEARRWFTTHYAYTDANGNYSVNGTFKNDCNYQLVFETGDFDVRSGTFGQAKIDGPKQNSNWNFDIADGIKRFYADVFRGAQRYWRENTGGLLRPKNAWLVKMKYGAFDKNKEPWTMPLVGNPGATPHVNIYRNTTNGGQFASDEIFSNTIHETAHWSHLTNFGTPNFTAAGSFVRESWATGVEWFITQMEYKEKGIANYGEPGYSTVVNYPAMFGYQYWRTGRNQDDYSSLFIDLFDAYNQHNQTFGNISVNPSPVNDSITGYTFANMESQILKYTQSKQDLFNRLKMYKPSGVTDAQLDLLTSSF